MDVVLPTLSVCWDELYLSRIMFPIKSCLKITWKDLRAAWNPSYFVACFIVIIIVAIIILKQPYTLGWVKKDVQREAITSRG